MFTISTSRSQQRRAAGFTLIELLVVIAIIAILTAIIFPVFATLRENARQKTAISNLHDIQNGLFQFKLDNGKYPVVLFGYAYPNARMDNALAIAQQYDAANPGSNTTAQHFPGLYPEYVKDPLTFTDPNNVVKDLSLASTEYVNYLTEVDGQTYTLTPASVYPYPASPTSVSTDFYLADAYDISPKIDSSQSNLLMGGNGNPSTYVVRYQTSWIDVGTVASQKYDNSAANPSYENYNRQLRWTNPPADTYITSDTHHVPNSNKVIVLWESGTAKAIDASQFLAGAAGNDSNSDTTTAIPYPPATPPTLNSKDTAKFWQVSPTQNSNPGP